MKRYKSKARVLQPQRLALCSSSTLRHYLSSGFTHADISMLSHVTVYQKSHVMGLLGSSDHVPPIPLAETPAVTYYRLKLCTLNIE